MTEEEMSDTKQEDTGRRGGGGGDEDRRSGADRDGPIPFLEELFRGDDDVPEVIRRRR